MSALPHLLERWDAERNQLQVMRRLHGSVQGILADVERRELEGALEHGCRERRDTILAHFKRLQLR